MVVTPIKSPRDTCWFKMGKGGDEGRRFTCLKMICRAKLFWFRILPICQLVFLIVGVARKNHEQQRIKMYRQCWTDENDKLFFFCFYVSCCKTVHSLIYMFILLYSYYYYYYCTLSLFCFFLRQLNFLRVIGNSGGVDLHITLCLR